MGAPERTLPDQETIKFLRLPLANPNPQLVTAIELLNLPSQCGGGTRLDGPNFNGSQQGGA